MYCISFSISFFLFFCFILYCISLYSFVLFYIILYIPVFVFIVSYYIVYPCIRLYCCLFHFNFLYIHFGSLGARELLNRHEAFEALSHSVRPFC